MPWDFDSGVRSCYKCQVMADSSAAAPATSSSQPSPLLVSLHQRFGKPQVYSLLLLFAFASQCFWLAARSPLTNLEMAYVSPGHAAEAAVGPESHSPVVAALAKAALALAFPTGIDSPLWRMWLRAPFVLIGGLLGASLWYVSRRLYGNAGGYIALALYAFSPTMIQHWAAVSPDVIAAWGAFGCIFTGIAVAHTLYAPREVFLWNYRRIILLAVGIGLGVAAVPATAFAVPIALCFMLYLVPHRRGATVGILSAACVLAFVVMFATFGFSWHALTTFVRESGTLQLSTAPMSGGVFSALAGGFFFRNGPAFTTLLLVTFCVWVGWRRARFFGTAAPLIVAVAFLVVGLLAVHRDVLVFLQMALPFLFVFTAGVCADLLELKSAYSGMVKALILATVFSNCLFSISGLIRM